MMNFKLQKTVDGVLPPVGAEVFSSAISNIISKGFTGVITFEKVDGSKRTMRIGNPPEEEKTSASSKAPNSDIFTMFSLDDNNWRSCRKNLIISFEVDAINV